MAISIRKVAVIGLGTLGAQIALQTAYKGYEVFGFDRDESIFQHHLDKFMAVDQSKVRRTPLDVAAWPETAQKIRFCKSLSEAVAEADLVIEVVPENLDLKKTVWQEIDKAAPAQAVLATNSSSLPVSKIEGSTSRPERCLNLHFYQLVMGQNMADVMGGTQTLPEVFEAGREFIRSLDMAPLTVNKELLGFCFNRVWRAIKKETLHMWADGFVDYRDVDRGWMIFNNSSWGPFSLMDAVGLDVIYDIEMVYYNESKDPKDYPPQELKEMIEAGNLGVKTGKGFYTYPDPEFQSPDFLKG